MKKQYLISLLGIIAISIPMGSSLLTVSNSSNIPFVEEFANGFFCYCNWYKYNIILWFRSRLNN